MADYYVVSPSSGITPADLPLEYSTYQIVTGGTIDLAEDSNIVIDPSRTSDLNIRDAGG